MNEKKPFVTEGHTTARKVFRILGPIILITGISLIAIAFIDFFKAFNSFMYEPDKFGYFFAGIPCVFVGAILCNLGYGSVAARYVAREMAPVTKDTFNYVGHEIHDGVKDISRAITEGKQEAFQHETIHCSKCSAPNEQNANFCSNCGTTLKNTCNACFEENTADANFCKKCGNEL